VPAGRHRKTTPWTSRLRRLGAPAGLVLTVATAIPVAAVTTAGSDEPVVAEVRAEPAERARTDLRASRSGERATPTPTATPTAAAPVRLTPRWTTTRLNVWTEPREQGKLLTVLDRAVKVRFTGEMRGQWAQIKHQDRLAWVRATYLAKSKPKPQATTRSGGGAVSSGVSGAPCPDGSAVESGLQANAVKVYRAVCAAYPAVSSWGGRRGSGDHGAGRALDIMCSGSLGNSIAEYVRRNASRLGVSEVIWAQRIWTVERSSEGWRPMEDRGSSTANHYDHVHVSVY
jgi:hypothetical protein